EITSGLVISGTTTLSSSGTMTVIVSDGTTSLTNSAVSYASGVWTNTLTTAQVQSLRNGQLTVTASLVDSSITLNDAAFPTLTLNTPVLTITDDIPGTA